MTELWMPQQAVDEGIAAYREALGRKLTDEQLVIEIYLAVEGMKRVIEMREEVDKVLH